MTAQEAREITLSSKKSLEEILEAINGMAKIGNDYATFNHSKVRSPEQYKEELEGLGYRVVMGEGYFKVTW